MSHLRKLMLIGAALLAVASSAFAASPAAGNTKPSAATVTDNADLQKLIQQFNARRDSILANREALLNQLKNATADQKKVLLEKMATDQKDLIEAQRALAKQIRDEMRRLRLMAPTGPGRR